MACEPALKRVLFLFLESSGADIVALQEVRAFPEQLPPEITSSQDWHASFFPGKATRLQRGGNFKPYRP